MQQKHESLSDYIELLQDSYDQITEISSGGGGIILKAHDKGLDKEVIIKKVIRSKVNSLGKTGERDMLKNLKHRNLPQIYAYIDKGEDVFTVMEYIPGKNFAEVLSETKGRFKKKDLVKWTVQLCDVVAYLHSQKPAIIHCDIKPANIMLTPQGDICLIDFNISNPKTEEGAAAIGYTPGYAPAEQLSLKYEHDKKKRAERENTQQIGFLQEKKPEEDTSSQDDLTLVDEDATVTDVTDDRTLVDDQEDVTAIDDNYGAIVNKGESRERKGILSFIKERTSTTSSDPMQGLTKAISVIQKEHIPAYVDERTDIYSMGATLYHIVTGVKPKPFYETNVQVQELVPSVPDGLAYLIQKSMSVRPEDRFKNCETMLKIAKQIDRMDRRYKRVCRIENALLIACGVVAIISVILMQRGKVTIQQERERSYSDLIAQMSRERESENYDALKALFDKAVVLNPDNSSSYYEMAQSLYQRKEYEECADYVLGNIISNDHMMKESGTDRFYYLMASSYFELDEYILASDYYEKAVSVNAKEPAYYRDYVISLARIGDTSKAWEVLEKAKECGITSDNILLLDGEISYIEKRYDQAEKSLTGCITESKEEETLIRAYSKLDEVYQKEFEGEKQLETRISMLERAVKELSPENQIILLERLAQVYMDYADLTEVQDYNLLAIDVLKKIRNLGYGTLQTDYNISILYEKTGDYDGALLWNRQILEERGEDYRWYKRLSYVELQKQNIIENQDRDYRQFLEYYKKATELYKNGKTDKNDIEMQILDQKYQDLIDQGWLEE